MYSLIFLSLPLLTLAATCPNQGTYVVQNGDTGIAISTKLSCNTRALLRLNSLTDQGRDLQAGATICVPNTCKIHAIVANETTTQIAASAGITIEQFHLWNLDVDGPGTNILTDYNVCVSEPMASNDKGAGNRRRRAIKSRFVGVQTV